MRIAPSALAAILLTAFTQHSSAKQFGDFEYYDEGTTITIDSYTNRGKTGAVVIPSTIDGKPVTEISPYAFEYCTRITSVTIPAGVTTVHSYAFGSCNSLASVTLPEGLTTLGTSVFDWCLKLKTIHIPSTLTDASKAFNDPYSNLETVTFAPGTTDIPESLFDTCRNLKSVTLPSSVKRIGDKAFSYCRSLDTIKLPWGLTEIGEEAFAGCPIAKVSFPSTLTTIGESAFQGCSFVRVSFPPSLRELNSRAFLNCKRLTTASFTGPAPYAGIDVFYKTSPDFSIFLEKGATGFQIPKWKGYAASKAAPEITVSTLNGFSVKSGRGVYLGARLVGSKGPHQQALITNTGIRPLTKLKASISGTGSSHFIIKGFKKKSLAPGKSTIVSVSFSPTKPGKHKARVLIKSNDKNEGSFVINLSGSGVEPK